MQEQASAGGVIYGRGKGKPCAEIRFDPQRKSPVLFLWLPLRLRMGIDQKSFTARMRIWTKDWVTVSDLGHIPKGLGRMVSFREWETGSVRPLNKILPSRKDARAKYFSSAAYRRDFVKRNSFLGYVPHYRSGVALTFEVYRRILQQPNLSDQLDAAVDVALNAWLSRL